MKHLKSLRDQKDALITVLDQAIKDRKDPMDIAEIQKQIKAVETMIYERKIFLQRQGLYEE